MTAVYHVLTPGDHYSPRTGSAIPTVVDGLARAAAAEPEGRYRHTVVLDRTTYTPRYPNVDFVEYDAAAPVSRAGRLLDYARAAASMPRRAIADQYLPVVTALRDAPPGIVIAHNATFLAAMLSTTAHTTVLYAHNALPASMQARETRSWMGAAAALICVSTDQADLAKERVPAEFHSRIQVVRHGVDTELFAPGERTASPIHVVFVGRTIPAKGVDVLIDAAARLTRRDIRITIVGSHGFDAHAPLTRFERRLRSHATRARVPIEFLPFTDRSALPGLLANAHALVVPSRWREPSGLTVGEGLASGAVVIATRVGGIPEVLGDAGVLVDPDDPVALAQAIDRVAQDSEWRRELGERARTRAHQHDWAWSWRQLREVLDAL